MPKDGAALTPAERRALVPLVAIMASRMLGLFLLLPVLALHAGAMPGGTALVAGLAVGAYGLAQALLQIPFGAASDRYGRRPLIVAGLALQAAGAAIGWLATTAWALVAARLVQGFGAVSGPALALLADSTRPDSRTRAMMFIGIGIGASFIVSLVAGPWLGAEIGVPGLFAATGALALGAVLLALVALPASPRPAAPAPRGAWRGALAGRLWPAYAGVFALHLTLTAVFIAVPLALRDLHGIEAGRHSLVYLAAFSASLALTVPLVVWTERGARAGRAALAGGALLGASLLAMLWGHGAFGLLAAALVAYFGAFNFLEARLPAVLAQSAGEGLRGAVLGVYATCQSAGAFAGGALGGFLLGGPAAQPGVYAMAALALLAWLPFARRVESR